MSLRICLILFIGIVVPLVSECAQQPGAARAQQDSSIAVTHALTLRQESMLDEVEHSTFPYFLNERHPDWGLIEDRAASGAPASIAATGFGIPCLAIGAERGWITRSNAASITLQMLRFFQNSEQSASTNATGFHGFYYHFLSMKDGRRTWNCELSSVDTGLLAMGFVFARNYYNHEDAAETNIRKIAGELVGRMDWDFMAMPSMGSYSNTISMGWTPENGRHKMGWTGYNEALFLYILAAGSGMKDAQARYQSWVSTYEWKTPYPGLPHLAFPPLFGHQFSQAFIDFRGLPDAYMRAKGIDYFENSRRATQVQRRYATDNPHGWKGYDALCWGISACDGPGDRFNSDGHTFHGYAGRGTSGPDSSLFDDGTIAPYACICSLPFAPEIVLPSLESMLGRYGDKLRGKYGLRDAFNPTVEWFDDDFVGIDQGPILIMIENFRTGLVWRQVMADPLIQRGLKRLGFERATAGRRQG